MDFILKSHDEKPSPISRLGKKTRGCLRNNTDIQIVYFNCFYEWLPEKSALYVNLNFKFVQQLGE